MRAFSTVWMCCFFISSTTGKKCLDQISGDKVEEGDRYKVFSTNDDDWILECVCGEEVTECTVAPGGHNCEMEHEQYAPGDTWTARDGRLCSCPDVLPPGDTTVTIKCESANPESDAVFCVDADGDEVREGKDYVSVSPVDGSRWKCTCGTVDSCTVISGHHRCVAGDETIHMPGEKWREQGEEGEPPINCKCPRIIPKGTTEVIASCYSEPHCKHGEDVYLPGEHYEVQENDMTYDCECDGDCVFASGGHKCKMGGVYHDPGTAWIRTVGEDRWNCSCPSRLEPGSKQAFSTCVGMCQRGVKYFNPGDRYKEWHRKATFKALIECNCPIDEKDESQCHVVQHVCVHSNNEYQVGDWWMQSPLFFPKNCTCPDSQQTEQGFRIAIPCNAACINEGVVYRAGDVFTKAVDGWLFTCTCPHGGTGGCEVAPGGHKCSVKGRIHDPGETWTEVVGNNARISCTCPDVTTAERPELACFRENGLPYTYLNADRVKRPASRVG